MQTTAHLIALTILFAWAVALSSCTSGPEYIQDGQTGRAAATEALHDAQYEGRQQHRQLQGGRPDTRSRTR